MHRSDLQMLFASKAFKEWEKARDSGTKLQLAVVERLDAVIRAFGSLGNVIVGVLRRR
ncbi:hypothetical protein [Paraburkholderia sp. J10-1]|uniref:hypothetical protein n=1 Tax=Paraburkholderia sp. J10-1 TaxID=2805430 RepID=UPI002AB6C4B5|nr:hypothetical protein [Paraburkholderia sp. J10-1]